MTEQKFATVKYQALDFEALGLQSMRGASCVLQHTALTHSVTQLPLTSSLTQLSLTTQTALTHYLTTKRLLKSMSNQKCQY